MPEDLSKFGPVKENGVCRIRTYQELMHLYREPDIDSEFRKERLGWLGHVERMPEERTVKKVFKNIPERNRSLRKPRKRWVDDVENDLKKMGVGGSRKIVRDKDTWKLILNEAMVPH
jgi:hypothetical protein